MIFEIFVDDDLYFSIKIIKIIGLGLEQIFDFADEGGVVFVVVMGTRGLLG